MDTLEKLISLSATHLSGYLSILLGTFSRRLNIYEFDEIAHSENNLINGSPHSRILSTKLIVFVLISITIGLILQSIILNKTSFDSFFLQATIVILSVWFLFSIVLHKYYQLLGGLGDRNRTIAVSLRILAASYIICSLAALLLTVIWSLISVVFIIPIVIDSAWSFFIIELITLFILLPQNLNTIHFPHENSKIKLTFRLVGVFGIITVFIFMSFLFFEVKDIAITQIILAPTPILVADEPTPTANSTPIHQVTITAISSVPEESDGTLQSQVTATLLASSNSNINFPTNPELGSQVTRALDHMEMAFVPSGSFPMGSALDDPEAEIFEFSQHFVSVNSFWLDKTEVTNEQYANFLNSQELNRWLDIDSEYSLISYNGERFQPLPNFANHPVIEVSWYGADEYCRWVNARLPTEEEWEYAARGPEGGIYPWGNDFNGENLNFCDINCSRDYKNEIFNDGFAMTSPVASFPNGQSWVGIYDMAGNVSEWTANGIYSYNPEADWSEQGFVSVETDPNPGYQKVVRGGSWNNTSRFARTAHRAFPAPEEQSEFVGFRCAISP